MRSFLPLIMMCATFAVTKIGAVPRIDGMAYNDNCVDPKREPGRCILVRECKIIVATLRKETLRNDDVAFLYESECGKLEGKSLVCCPNYSITPAAATEQQGGESFGTANRVDQTGDDGNSTKLDQWKFLPQPGECGTQPSYQLFGENVTKLDEQPWTALIHFGNMPYETTFECGGALISSRYVLTAAHCVADSRKWSKLTVRLGEWDTEATVDCISIEDNTEFYCADPALDVPVQSVIIHEQYSRQHRPQLNDIALLRLAEPVNTTAWIRPVCLPERLVLPTGAAQIFTLAGWGNNGCGYNSRYKVRSKLNALSQDQCKKHLPMRFRRANDFLCTVPAKEGEKCHADSGGAVTSSRVVSGVGVVHEVAGILNHMRDCQVRPVGLFASVGQYVDWIVSKMEE